MPRSSAVARTIRRLLPVCVLISTICVLALTPAPASADFEPTADVSLDDAQPGASSDIEIEVSIPAGDVNADKIVAFLPPQWQIAEGNTVPVGAEMGRLRADVSLGLINSPCNQVLFVEFPLYNASVDTQDKIDFHAEDGGGDPFTVDWAEDLDGNGLIQAVDQWPEFLDRVLEDAEHEPIQRIAGMSIIASTPVLVQFLVFPPGTTTFDPIPNSAALGYPVVALLQDYGDPQTQPEPGVITDFCSPLRARMDFFGISRDNGNTPADESGAVLLTNPAAGSYPFTIATTSQRDADGDGFENRLDTCPHVPNIGDPTVPTSGDLDSDGMDAACDPNDNPMSGGTNSDQDADGYVNRQDNCPLVVNGEDATNQADADLDGIGDDCDPDPFNPDAQGASTLVCLETVVQVGNARSRASLSTGNDLCLVSEPADPMTKGNLDCDDDIDSVDALQLLRYVAGQPSQQPPGCPSIADLGDIDCDGGVNAVDALAILRFIAGLPIALPDGCPTIGIDPV